MPGVKTNEREGTRAVLRHSRISASKVRQVLDLIRGQDVDRAAEILQLARPRGRGHRRQGAGLGGGQRRPQRRARRRGTVRVGLLRRRGHHPQAVASPGPGPGHADPQADLPHHHHREPPPRGSHRPTPGRAGGQRRPALPPGGRLPPAPAGRADRRHRPPMPTTDTGAEAARGRGFDADDVATEAEAGSTLEGPRPTSTTRASPTRPTPTTSRRGRRGRNRRDRDRTRSTRPTSRQTATADGRAGREGQVDGPEGKPLRVPARRHHRLEVALVRGAQLPELRDRGLEDPRLPDVAARVGRRQPDRDRAHP